MSLKEIELSKNAITGGKHHLYNHLKKDTDYEVVFKSKDKKTFLFKRNIVK